MLIHQLTNSYGNYLYNAFIYRGAQWESHFHRSFELIYCMEGSAEISLNNVKYTLLPGELMLISPYTIHSITGIEPSKIWVGVFSGDFVPEFSEKNKFTNYIRFRLSDDVQKFLDTHLFYEGKPEHYILISCLYMICNECAKQNRASVNKSNYKFMYGVIDYISENLSQDITLKEIAKSLNYEYHYFSALFHRHFYMNFKSFINIFRFESACSLLKSSNETITAIAGKCGFGSIRNFNRIFKQISGKTPCEYRKNSP